MSACPTPPRRPIVPRRLERGHIVALTAVAVAAFGLLGLRAVELPQPRPVSDSDRLRIEVVPPVEPKIVPGSVMEVGELVDGFQGLPPPLPALEEVDWSHLEAWDDGAGDRSPPRRAAVVYVPLPPPPREPAPRSEGRWFGFDAPRRDFQAERAARRARMEAMDRRAHEAREARRRDWLDRREEWLSRRDERRAPDHVGDPPVEEWASAGPRHDEARADGGSFAGADSWRP